MRLESPGMGWLLEVGVRGQEIGLKVRGRGHRYGLGLQVRVRGRDQR